MFGPFFARVFGHVNVADSISIFMTVKYAYSYTKVKIVLMECEVKLYAACMVINCAVLVHNWSVIHKNIKHTKVMLRQSTLCAANLMATDDT